MKHQKWSKVITDVYKENKKRNVSENKIIPTLWATMYKARKGGKKIPMFEHLTLLNPLWKTKRVWHNHKPMKTRPST